MIFFTNKQKDFLAENRGSFFLELEVMDFMRIQTPDF
jgi:hypothetical protein